MLAEKQGFSAWRYLDFVIMHSNEHATLGHYQTLISHSKPQNPNGYKRSEKAWEINQLAIPIRNANLPDGVTCSIGIGITAKQALFRESSALQFSSSREEAYFLALAEALDPSNT